MSLILSDLIVGVSTPGLNPGLCFAGKEKN